MNQKIINEIRSKALEYWKNVQGIALFGSCVRSNKYNDIDILIVLDKINKDRIERAEDIADFRRNLDIGKSADIMLVSLEECRENFREHNPLYLDIALEGKIIYDTGVLRYLMDETKDYIKNHNILRNGTTWIFPLKKPLASLSRVTNRDWAEAWLEDAKRDLSSAKFLYDKKLFEKVVYHSQQCVEKSVKAILICFGAFEKSHYVSRTLRDEMSKRNLENAELNELITIAENLEPHISLSRYPGISHGDIWLPYEEYSRKNATDSIDNAEKAIKISRKFMEDWFK